MVYFIGETAGKVWRFLHKHGESNLTQIKKGVKEDGKLIMGGIGWLAREDKLIIEKKGRVTTYRVKAEDLG